MLNVQGLTVAFGGRSILKDVDVVVEAGQVLAVLGRNGAGKSTLVKALAGLLPYRGAVHLDGQNLAQLSLLQRSGIVGYVAQDLASLSARLTVFELLLLAQNSRRVGWAVASESLQRAEAILDLLEIRHLAHVMPGHMSGGQRQMVALALALVRRPRLLLLDEPTSALDLANQLHLLDTVQRYTREQRMVTLMVLHDLNLASRYADTVLMLRQNAGVVKGPTKDVLTQAQLASVYGVHCHIVPVDGRTAIYPLEVVSPSMAG